VRFRFLWIGSTKETAFASLEKTYLQRINRYVPCDCVAVPELKKSDRRSEAGQLRREGDAVLKKLLPGAFLIVLDERGEELSSTRFAQFIGERLRGNHAEVAFVVGGFLGLTEEITQRADFRLSLSQMTLPHELARVLLLEQVFRAFSILNGLPYHR